MSSFAKSIALCFAATLAFGCYKTTKCEQESCDFSDNDCDTRVDEAFVDENGVYWTREHCGGCGIDCNAELPTAATTACAVDSESSTATCVVAECPEGWHQVDARSCAPDLTVRCLPCEEDRDCDVRLVGARCVELPGDGLRCLEPCTNGCVEGFACSGEADTSVCLPESGVCACTQAVEGVDFACLLESPTGDVCAGAQECLPTGLGECEAGLVEACNATDDDCDGEVDEEFVNESGLYVARLHCGECNEACVEPGPNMVARCLVDAGSPSGVSCEIECEEGFVDVDGLPANGCECERFDGTGEAPPVGSDADCDGDPDDDDAFIYVRTTGNDSDPGTLIRPMRTIQAAIAEGLASGKDVLVAVGTYDGGLGVVGGVSVFGGYRTDFRQRDPGLFPVVVERRGVPGAPVLTCDDVTATTEIDGFEIRATEALVAGAGSTAVYLDQCGDGVVLRDLLVIAARAADGARGASSSDLVGDFGFGSLEELDGTDGDNGLPGTGGGACTPIAAGAGGTKACPLGAVSGGSGGGGDCPELSCTNGSPCGNSGCTDYTVDGECDFDAMLADAVSNPAPADGAGPAPGTAGAVTYNAPTNRGVCSFCDDNPTLQRFGRDGSDGAEGTDGAGGPGCDAAVSFDAASGLVAGLSGGTGTPGTDGSGGGGGSAGAGYAVIGATAGSCSDRSGGSGGGGGSGGCGAPAANGGFGGGASVGVVIRMRVGSATGPVFDDVRIVTASGGRGGDGGVGASGGAAGGGGNGGGTTFWCAKSGGRGGDGGRGGAGGGGGGGCGGASHGVFIDGRSATPDAYAGSLGAAVTVEATGVPGAGGSGGFAPNAAGENGTPGAGDDVFILR